MRDINANIDFWEQAVKNPPEAYKNLFEKEKEYLRKTLTKNSTVLDIGCGDGRNILSFIDMAKEITGLDNSEHAVKDAQENLKNYPNVQIVLGDAFNLPFDDNVFDFAILSMTLVNFADNKVKALQEMRRVVKDDGKVIISVYSEKALPDRLSLYKQVGSKILKEENGYITFENEGLTSEQFSREQLETLVDQAGLKIVDLEKVGDLAYIVTLSKNTPGRTLGCFFESVYEPFNSVSSFRRQELRLIGN